tara:strand:+ start:2412 stop:2933 length:522 start_codon:yes stop_codon:yes gene_type:complete
MNLSKLKESRLRKKFNDIVLKLQDNRAVPQKEILTVGILTTESISSTIDVQSEIETILGLKNSKLYSFKKFNKSDEVCDKHFSEKDVNWRGNFTEPTFKNFLEQPFDLLIGYFNNHHLYLEKAVLESKATFKVGFSDVNSKLYELEISTELENIQQFSSELKKYLQILKKLKN